MNGVMNQIIIKYCNLSEPHSDTSEIEKSGKLMLKYGRSGAAGACIVYFL